MPPTFSEQPILNSPYEYPAQHWELGSDGIPTDRIAEQRREAKHVVPVPPPRRSNQQRAMQLGIAMPTDEGQEYDPSPIINEIRRHVDAWRQIPNPSSWGVSPGTARLLQHWRGPGAGPGRLPEGDVRGLHHRRRPGPRVDGGQG